MAIVGHQKQLQLLDAARESGRLSHAYILAGPAKIGKKTFALEWLSQLIGVRLSERSAHPDFLFLASAIDPKTGPSAGEVHPRGGKKSTEITVEQTREFIRKLSLTPAISKFKAAVIDDAHLMNRESQNTLLKTLEEPPGQAIIILIATNPGRLLATIRSRCQIVQFNFVPAAQVKDYIKLQTSRSGGRTLDVSLLEEIAGLAAGRPGRAADLLADLQEIKKWRAAEKEFSRAMAGDLVERFAYIKKITDDEENDLAGTLEIWQSYLRNKLLAALSGESAGVQPPELRGLDPRQRAGGDTPQKIAAILKKIQDLDLILQTTNASPRLALENFMLEI